MLMAQLSHNRETVEDDQLASVSCESVTVYGKQDIPSSFFGGRHLRWFPESSMDIKGDNFTNPWITRNICAFNGRTYMFPPPGIGLPDCVGAEEIFRNSTSEDELFIEVTRKPLCRGLARLQVSSSLWPLTNSSRWASSDARMRSRPLNEMRAVCKMGARAGSMSPGMMI
ncbi:hypothetical protein BDV19DRAFT_370919 [Aspergillus venezuelensis]